MNREEFVCELCSGVFDIEFTNWVNVKKYDAKYIIRTCDSCANTVKYDPEDTFTGILLELDNE